MILGHSEDIFLWDPREIFLWELFCEQRGREQLPDEVTQVSIIRNISNPFGLQLDQKAMKSGQKWLSYAQFTYRRLRDSSEYHVGFVRSLGASFEPKSYEIGQEMAELWPIYLWEVA